MIRCHGKSKNAQGKRKPNLQRLICASRCGILVTKCLGKETFIPNANKDPLEIGWGGEGKSSKFVEALPEEGQSLWGQAEYTPKKKGTHPGQKEERYAG